MGHDSVCSTDENVTKLTRGKEVDNPLFDFIDLDIKTGTDHTTFVNTTSQFNDNLAASVIINDLKFSNVACGRPYGKDNQSVSITLLCECENKSAEYYFRETPM